MVDVEICWSGPAQDVLRNGLQDVSPVGTHDVTQQQEDTPLYEHTMSSFRRGPWVGIRV